MTYMKKDLQAKGWTEGAIKRFLPRPQIENRSNYYGSYRVYQWATELVDEVRKTPEVQEYFDSLKKRQQRRQSREPEPLPLLTAIREISRAAHRWRDAASKQYEAGNYGLASYSSSRKSHCYALKERGIAAAYLQGLLRYAGQTPQGMALYEYGDGGMSCFHSCLHPVGVERRDVEGHMEVLFVETKKAQHLVEDAESALSELPVPGETFERVSPPRRAKHSVAMTCWQCGEDGHISRECPERMAE